MSAGMTPDPPRRLVTYEQPADRLGGEVGGWTPSGVDSEHAGTAAAKEISGRRGLAFDTPRA